MKQNKPENPATQALADTAPAPGADVATAVPAVEAATPTAATTAKPARRVAVKKVPAVKAAPTPVAKTPLVKVKKPKLIRDSYAMPDNEYAQFPLLKERALAAGVEVKKSELLRAGLAALSAMTDRNFLAALSRLQKLSKKR